MTTTAIIAAGEARAAQVATMPRTQLIRGVDMDQPINWGPEREYTGNGECPADARDVPCMISGTQGWRGHLGNVKGRDWGRHNWQHVTAYRLPVAVTAPAADPVRDALPATIIVRMAQTKDGHIAIRNTDLDDEDLGACLIPIEHIDALIAAIALAKGEKL